MVTPQMCASALEALILTPYGFSCANPDFTIRVLPSDVKFEVQRSKMAEGSTVFRDMFGVCEDTTASQVTSDPTSQAQELEVHEGPDIFALFLRLLHHGGSGLQREALASLDGPVGSPKPGTGAVIDGGSAGSSSESLLAHASGADCIPLPVLRPLFDLADKYDISSDLHKVLEGHLALNSNRYPLEVYAMGTTLGIDSVSIAASAHLLSRRLDSYSMEEISIIPSVQAYRRLVLLHAHRIEKLRGLLMDEEVFPHDYGICPKHGENTRELWRLRKINLKWGVDAGTDVAEEMQTVLQPVQNCEKCLAGCEKAIAMLKYKCDRVPRTFNRVPGCV